VGGDRSQSTLVVVSQPRCRLAVAAIISAKHLLLVEVHVVAQHVVGSLGQLARQRLVND
jgi:hypothetical protein